MNRPDQTRVGELSREADDRRNAAMIARMERGGRRRFMVGMIMLIAGLAILLLAAAVFWWAIHRAT